MRNILLFKLQVPMAGDLTQGLRRLLLKNLVANDEHPVRIARDHSRPCIQEAYGRPDIGVIAFRVGRSAQVCRERFRIPVFPFRIIRCQRITQVPQQEHIRWQLKKTMRPSGTDQRVRYAVST